MSHSLDPDPVDLSPHLSEERLWAKLDGLLDGVSIDLAYVSPIRIITPTRGLRDHLTVALLRHRKRAVLGVRVQTLFGLAAEILERSGSSKKAGNLFFSWLVSKWGRVDEVLGPLLEPFEEGWNLVVESVEVLLDAGLTKSHLPAVADWFAGPGKTLGRDQGERLQALIRLSLAAQAGLLEANRFRSKDLFKLAEEELSKGTCLPCRALFLYGFDPGSALENDFLDRLRELHPSSDVFTSTRDFSEKQPQEKEDFLPFRPDFLEAEDCESEVREVVLRVFNLLEGGITPERMAIILPPSESYSRLLRHRLGAAGLPFSGPSIAGPLGPLGRVFKAFTALLQEKGSLALDSWFELLEPSADAPSVDCRLAWRMAGIARMTEAAQFEPSSPVQLPFENLEVVEASDSPNAPEEQMSLPFGSAKPSQPVLPEKNREGSSKGPSSGALGHKRGRFLPPEAFQTAAGQVNILLGIVNKIPPRGTMQDYENWTLHLLEDGLGWSRAFEPYGALVGIIHRLTEAFPPGLTMEVAEFREYFRREIDRRGGSSFGGRGGGVQVLSLAEAWGRTFDYAAVLGLTQGEFPALRVEDSLLPDPLRSRLRVLLPHLPLREERSERTERQFRSLMLSAPQILLSRPLRNAKGQTLGASPFWRKERVLSGLPGLEVAESDRVPTSLFETLVERTQRQGRDYLRLAIPHWVRLPDGIKGVGLEARLQALEELDPRPDTPFGQARWRSLGPFFGRIGGDGGKPLYVTHLERNLQCSWRTFLTSRLQVQPLGEPVGYLGSVSPPLVGRILHGVLDRWVRTTVHSGGKTLSQLLGSRSKTLRWPEKERWDSWVAEESRKVAISQGISFLTGALAVRTQSLLEKAKTDLDGIAALGAEVSGELAVRVGEKTLPLFFRADLVDQDGGVLRITDFKTGKKPKPSTFRRLLERGSLQAMAYALAEGGTAEGRYLYLGSTESEEVGFSATNGEWISGFESTVATLVQGWWEGVAIPRFLTGDLKKNHPQCSRCEVAPACLYQDSTSHRRWARWIEKMETMGEANPWEGFAFRLWSLGGRS